MDIHAKMARSFGSAAEIYDVGRPSYPNDAVAWMLEPVMDDAQRPVRAVDVGAGTGILTRTVADLGTEVTAVDPDAAMLAQLESSVPDVPTAVGTAEDLPLPDASADAIVAGQAWHWVEPVAGSRECGRVLRPGGVLGLIWNSRETSRDWTARLDAILNTSAAERMIAEQGVEVHSPFGPVEQAEWRWSRPMTRDQMLAMARSRSYVITASPEKRATIESELAELFDTLDLHGDTTIDLPYVTTAFRARNR